MQAKKWPGKPVKRPVLMVRLLSFPERQLALVLLPGLVSVLTGLPASAGPQTPAPVVFAQSAAPAGSLTGPDLGPGRRTEFRYPDQPDIYFSGQGKRAAETAEPLVFSSPKAAISYEEARSFIQSRAGEASSPGLLNDPNLSPGAFDARLAARAAAQAEVDPPAWSSGSLAEPMAITGLGLPPANSLPATGAAKLYVQLASFRDITNAEGLLDLIQLRLPAEIVPALINGTQYYRVRVGPVSDRAAADSLRDLLDFEGVADGRVVLAP